MTFLIKHDNRQPDTPAVDREALAEWLYTELEWQGDPDSHWESLRSQDLYRWRAIAGQLLEHWGILDAAAVRHEHGERIADAVMPKLVDVYGTNGFPVRLLRQALGYTVSPAPDLGTPWTPPDGAFTDPDVHDPRDLSPDPPTEG